jgi:hypothetical protein
MACTPRARRQVLDVLVAVVVAVVVKVTSVVVLAVVVVAASLRVADVRVLGVLGNLLGCYVRCCDDCRT